MVIDIVYFSLAALFVFIGYRVIKAKPELLEGEALLEASKTLAYLAIGLMSMVVFSVYFLRSL